VEGLEEEEGALMPHARIFFEHQGFVYALGVVRNHERGRARVALRAASSREFSLLRPFASVREAEQLREAMAHAQVMTFADDGVVEVSGRHKRKHPGGRRRRPRIVVDPVSKPVARPSAPVRPQVAAPSSLSSGPMPRRAFIENRRPNPATAAELETVIDRLETGT
jgi:hypothetical protein